MIYDTIAIIFWNVKNIIQNETLCEQNKIMIMHYTILSIKTQPNFVQRQITYLALPENKTKTTKQIENVSGRK